MTLSAFMVYGSDYDGDIVTNETVLGDSNHPTFDSKRAYRLLFWSDLGCPMGIHR